MYFTDSGTIECIGWRQTARCDPDGSRENDNDRNCMSLIDDVWSGFCECSDGIQRMRKWCEKGKYKTCYAACSQGK